MKCNSNYFEMKQTKFISRSLHYLCYFLAIIYVGTFIYSLFCLITGYGITDYDQSIYLQINYPFTNRPFLNVDNNPSYITFSFLLPLLLYVIFFLLAARLFRVFFQQKLFTEGNIVELRRFYIYNIFAPLPIVIVASIFVPIEPAIWYLVFMHFILGIFSLFFANIFKQGLQLQNEQDLYI